MSLTVVGSSVFITVVGLTVGMTAILTITTYLESLVSAAHHSPNLLHEYSFIIDQKTAHHVNRMEKTYGTSEQQWNIIDAKRHKSPRNEQREYLTQ